MHQVEQHFFLGLGHWEVERVKVIRGILPLMF